MFSCAEIGCAKLSYCLKMQPLCNLEIPQGESLQEPKVDHFAVSAGTDQIATSLNIAHGDFKWPLAPQTPDLEVSPCLDVLDAPERVLVMLAVADGRRAAHDQAYYGFGDCFHDFSTR